MRILIFQTPKLTYVQTLEYLLRETAEQKVDLAVLPEFSLEHPAQCTNQSELSYDNVSIMMLSRLAKQRQLYLVLGSVEERCPYGVFDTCVVFNRSGEMILQYRKNSEQREEALNCFQTEYGTVGVLLGAEVEDESRWSSLLSQCVLILNPCNAPMELDQALAKAHPELQIAAWHKGFRRMEALVQSRLRSFGATADVPRFSFVRADAPLRQGGAGLSILVEPNRSVLVPTWGPSFFVVEVDRDRPARKLPKWRTLSIEEIIKAASKSSHDRELLKCDTVEIGPRYRVWTLRTPTLSKAALTQAGEWSTLWAERNKHEESVHTQNSFHSLSALVGLGTKASCFFLPITTRDGRHLYVVAERSASITLWDLRHRREFQSFSFAGSTGSRLSELCRECVEDVEVTAVGAGPSTSQFVVAGVTETGLLLQLFEEKKLLQDFSFSFEDFPWDEWKLFPPLELEEKILHQEEDDKSDKSHTVKIRGIFWSSPLQAVAIADSEDPKKPEVALLLDLDGSSVGSVQILDIICDGPPKLDAIEEMTETQDLSGLSASIPSAASEADELQTESSFSEKEERDKLVMVRAFERQRFPESKYPQSGLVCLWKSDRLCIVTYSDWKVHDQVLVDDPGTAKDRLDMPLCASILPGDGACSVLASYASMIIRWWRVSLKSCFQQACVVLSSPVTNFGLLYCYGEAPPEDYQEYRRISQSSLDMSKAARQSLNFTSFTTSSQRVSTLGGIGGTSQKLSSQRRPSRSSGSDPKVTLSLDNGLVESSATILISAIDRSGELTIFLGQGANLKKIYTIYSDLSTSPSTTVDCIWMMETHVALLQRNGDVRHIEFDINGELMRLADLFGDEGSEGKNTEIQ